MCLRRLPLVAAAAATLSNTGITVNNVSPVFRNVAASPTTINPGDTTSLSVELDESGRQDPHKVVIDWGDGSQTTTLNLAGVGTVSTTHQYTTSGSYTINVTATDDDTGSNSASTSVTVNAPPPTPQDATHQVVADVSNLLNSGTLTRGEANSLKAKLQAALNKVNQGNKTAAKNQLNAFINEVNALVNSGRLTQAEGQALNNAATDVINQL